ncbi:hotdog fold thioesterase [Planctomycetota bacterium]
MSRVQQDLVKLLFERIIPFNRYLGMSVLDIEPGLARLQLPFRDEFVGNPEIPALHGGVVSTLLDTVGGAAVWSGVEAHDRVSTVDLRVDFLRPGRSELLVGQGRVVRLGNRVGVVELRAYHHGAEDRPVAVGTGVYNVSRVKATDAAKLWDRVKRA